MEMKTFNKLNFIYIIFRSIGLKHKKKIGHTFSLLPQLIKLTTRVHGTFIKSMDNDGTLFSAWSKEIINNLIFYRLWLLAIFQKKNPQVMLQKISSRQQMPI
jgi:lipopolysaccharide biosynthesis glycosyltransferase